MTTNEQTARRWISANERMTVTVPEGEVDGMRVERFTVDKHDVHNLQLALRGRETRPGTYTRLMEGRAIWMSDTDAEKRDHIRAVQQMQLLAAKRVLINGLGLGMVLAAALSFEHVEHVDVVEKDRRVVELVGPHYLRDPRVVIHISDAWEQAKEWTSGTRWDVGWSDIWGAVSPATLPEMTRMNRSYGRRCTWHGCWAQEELLAIRAREQREARLYRGFRR
jgi:hypothetical protein